MGSPSSHVFFHFIGVRAWEIETHFSGRAVGMALGARSAPDFQFTSIVWVISNHFRLLFQFTKVQIGRDWIINFARLFQFVNSKTSKYCYNFNFPINNGINLRTLWIQLTTVISIYQIWISIYHHANIENGDFNLPNNYFNLPSILCEFNLPVLKDVISI